MFKYFTLTVALILTLFSCNQEEKINKNVPPPLENSTSTVQQCGFTINKDASTIQWSAFKFANKTEVKGAFEKFSYQLNDIENPTMDRALENLAFQIDVNSINTNDSIRDKRIKEIFFKEFTENKPIQGRVKSFDEDKIVLSFSMNHVTRDANLNYERIDDHTIRIYGTLDLLKWNGAPAVEQLNEVCKQLHIGPDGTSKLWSEVDVNVTLTFENLGAC